MTSPHRRLITGAILAGTAALAAATAIAADPGEGKVSAAAPKVTWTGETTGSYLVLNPMANDAEDVPCQAPTCDEFTLTVEGGGVDLVLSNEVDDDDATGGIRVEDEAGTVTWANGDSSNGKPFKLKIPKAKAGVYKVGMVNNFIDGPKAYNGAAELAVKPAPAPAAPPPAPASPPPSSGGQATVFTMTVKAPRKASAKKLRKARRLVATVTVSRPVQKIVAALRKGSKTVGKGARGISSGTVKLPVKVGKLKPGSYKLTVAATDGNVTSSKTLAIKITR